jgi:hypothetical protein
MAIKTISQTLLFSAALLLLTPSTSLGYFATDRTATRVTDHTALYTIDFSFGFAKKDVYIPVVTERTETNDITNPLLGYTFSTKKDRYSPTRIKYSRTRLR